MKNPCGKYIGMENAKPISKKSNGTLGNVLGRKGTAKIFITGRR